MNDHYALGFARGAARVIQAEQLLLVAQLPGHRLGTAGGEELLVIHFTQWFGSAALENIHDFFQRLEISQDGTHGAAKLGISKEKFGAGMIEDIGDFTGREADVERHQDPARQRHAIMGFEHRRDIRTYEGDTIAAFQTCFSQRGRQPIHAAAQFGVGVSLVIKFDGNFIWKHQRAPVQKLLRCEQALRRSVIHLISLWPRRAGDGKVSSADGCRFIRCREGPLFDELDKSLRCGRQFFATPLDQAHLA